LKTTINLNDDLYKRLVKETVERYGNTKNLSRLINERLERAEGLAYRTDSDDIKNRLKALRESAGSWNISKSGKEYVTVIRRGWSKRLNQAGLQ